MAIKNPKENCNVAVLFTSSGVSGAEKNLSRLIYIDPCINLRLVVINGLFSATKNRLFSYLNDKSTKSILTSLWQLNSVLRLHKTEIIYAVGVKALALSLLLRILRLHNAKIILGLRWSISYCIRDLCLVLQLHIFKKYVHGIISNSDYALKPFRKSHRCTVIYNSCPTFLDVPDVNYKKISNTKKLKLVYVGSLIERKSIYELISIGNECGLFQYAQLTVLGDGPLFIKIKEYINENNLMHDVILHGRVSDVYGILKNHDLLVLPSLTGEGCPTCLLEARGAKIPSVYFESEGNGEQQINGLTGIGLRDLNIKSLVNLLLEISCDSKMLDSIRNHLKSEANQYPLENFLSSHMSFFIKCLQ